MNETMFNKDDMDKIDACILQTLMNRQSVIGTTDKALGEQAFSWMSSPIMKIQAIKGRGGKKPQQMRFPEIVNLCEALGLSWQEVCREALKAVKAASKNPA